jgi:hypothetical protein
MDKATTLKKMDALYDKFVLPVEAEHYGEFVVVNEDGRMVFGPTLTTALAAARPTLGRGTFSFRVGERVVGRLR